MSVEKTRNLQLQESPVIIFSHVIQLGLIAQESHMINKVLFCLIIIEQPDKHLSQFPHTASNLE